MLSVITVNPPRWTAALLRYRSAGGVRIPEGRRAPAWRSTLWTSVTPTATTMRRHSSTTAASPAEGYDLARRPPSRPAALGAPTPSPRYSSAAPPPSQAADNVVLRGKAVLSPLDLPLVPQLQSGMMPDVESLERRRGKQPHMTLLGHADKTEAYREAVDKWQPVVRVLPDQRMRVVLVGPMNVGKSTLCNVLCRGVGNRSRGEQLVKDFDGITRDAIDGIGKIDDMTFTVIDTPGAVNGVAIEESARAIETADVAIFVGSADRIVDAEARNLAAYVASVGVPVLLVVNKADLVSEPQLMQKVARHYTDELRLGAPLFLHRHASTDMWDKVEAALRPMFNVALMNRVRADWRLEDLAARGDEDAIDQIRIRNGTAADVTPSTSGHELATGSGASSGEIRIALIGRPNSGKSSLLNRLVGFERSRAHDDIMTTRDAVEVRGTYRGRRVCVIDTAGLMRRMQRSEEPLPNLLYAATIKAIKFAHVCVVCFDATEGHPSNFDMAIAHTCLNEGRAFLLAANKWDAVIDQSATAEAIDFKIKRQLNEAKNAQAVVVSAKDGQNLHLLMDHCIEVYEKWNMHLRSGDVTRFWRKMEKSIVWPKHLSRVSRIVQTHARPPTFLLRLQTRDAYNTLPSTQTNLLRSAIADEFGITGGVPIRIVQETKDSHPDFI